MYFCMDEDGKYISVTEYCMYRISQAMRVDFFRTSRRIGTLIIYSNISKNLLQHFLSFVLHITDPTVILALRQYGELPGALKKD